MDKVTQLQTLLQTLTNQMYTYVGILQRDAPPAPLIAANIEEARQASEKSKEFNANACFLAKQLV